MKAYNITELAAELNSSYNVRHRNKVCYCLSFSWAWLPEAHTYGIYRTIINRGVGRLPFGSK